MWLLTIDKCFNVPLTDENQMESIDVISLLSRTIRSEAVPANEFSTNTDSLLLDSSMCASWGLLANVFSGTLMILFEFK